MQMTICEKMLCSGIGLLIAVLCPSVSGEGLPLHAKDQSATAFRVAPVFCDGMLLPSDAPIEVWGWGPGGTRVSVSAGGQTRETSITPEGGWRVQLAPMKAASGLEMKVSGAGSNTFRNVSVGDVKSALTPVRKLLVDPHATVETVALFYNLKMYPKRHTLIGQQDPEVSYTGQSGETDIKRTTGSDPAVWGSDFMQITHAKNTGGKGWFHDEERRIIGLASAAYDKGMVNVFCWHFQEPYDEKTFYRKDMDKANVQKAFRSILPGGEKHEWYKRKLRKVAQVVGDIRGSNGTAAPVIFRPFHEFDGDWFWWGKPYCSAGEFQECWRFTVKYLRDELKVHNLLYAFSPDCHFNSEKEYLERYPGDAYVDLVGFDDYSDFEGNRAAAAAAKVAIISQYARKHMKLAALTEVGYRKQPVPANLYTGYYGAVLADQSVELAFMMFWRQGRAGKSEYFVPVPGCDTVADFLKFANGPKPLFLSSVKNLYSVPAFHPLQPEN